MQIVIDIPKVMFINAKKDLLFGADILVNAIKNGTPLPKVHGRMIILSEDAVKREQTPLKFSCQNWISEAGLSNATVAIIEADKSEIEKCFSALRPS